MVPLDCQIILIMNKKINKPNQLHAGSHTQQSRQRQLSVKTLRFPLSTEFFKAMHVDCGTQRQIFSLEQGEEILILINNN